MPCSYEMHRLTLLAKHLSKIAREKGITIKEALNYLVNKNESSRSRVQDT